MKKLRVFLATAVVASAIVVGGATPAKANCEGDPNVCVLICEVGTNNKHTERFFQFCYVW